LHVREILDTDAGSGNLSWSRGASMGTINAVYMEDNTFVSDETIAAVDAEAGSRYVFRHNSSTNMTVSMHDAVIVGARSALTWEIYQNDFTVTLDYTSGPIGIRGGTGVVFGNRITSASAYPFYTNAGNGIAATLYRACDNTHQAPWNAWCDGTAGKACFGTQTDAHSCSTDADCKGEAGACQDLDGSDTGYPCRDQMGMGGNTAHLPALFWDNTLNGTPVQLLVYNAFDTGEGVKPACGTDPTYTASTFIALDRDYCEDDATMPASCAGQSTNYAPFTYPHTMITDCTAYPSLCDR
jgi:hypothetical protein